MDVIKKHARAYIGVLLVVLLIFIAGLSYGGYRYYHLFTEKTALDAELADASSTNQQLQDALTAEKSRNDNFESEIGAISGTVGMLNKLSQTDPQLLAKYSKVYFLNENYTPASLSSIPSEMVFDKTREYQFLSPVLPHLEDLINAAKSDSVTLLVASAYRSFGTQSGLKASYRATFGSGANSFSADQGYSEHQLGTAVDFTTPEIGGGLTGFDKTDAYTWLTSNAYQYGFILSYPPHNAYYIFEPWHWRYVGIQLATTLHDRGQYFYDLDQREINSYLIDFF